jgi:outer membrane protein TolC
LLLAAGPALAQGNETLGWLEAINQALSANQSLAAAQEDLEAAHEDVSIAKANFLPSVDIHGLFLEAKARSVSPNAGIIPSTTGLVGAKLTQMIFDEKAFANYSIQQSLYASQEQQVRSTRFGIIAAAGQAYVGVLLAEDLLEVQNENLELTEQNLQTSRDREQVGETSFQEVLRWQTQLYANKRQVLESKSSVLLSRFALNQVRDRPEEEHYELHKLTLDSEGFIFSSDVIQQALDEDDKARVVRDYLVELGLTNAPALAALDLELEAQQRQLSSDDRWLIPSFAFSAGADHFLFTAGQDDNIADTAANFWTLSASFNWSIFDGGANLAKVHQAGSELRALQSQRKELQTSLEQAIRASAAVAIADFQAIDFARLQAEVAEQNYALVYDSYLVGETTLQDLLDAQSQRIAAHSAATVAFYTFLADLLSVEQAIGYFPFLEPTDRVSEHVRELERKLQGD